MLISYGAGGSRSLRPSPGRSRALLSPPAAVFGCGWGSLALGRMQEGGVRGLARVAHNHVRGRAVH